VKGMVLLDEGDLGTVPDGTLDGAKVAADGVTVMTLVMTVGTQVVMAMVLKTGAGGAAGAEVGPVGGGTTTLDFPPAGGAGAAPPAGELGVTPPAGALGDGTA